MHEPTQNDLTEPAQPSEAATEASAQAQPETLPSLEEMLRIAELKAEENHDAWLRAKAETENLRRRAQTDIANAHKYAAEKFAEAMLPVKDSLETALAIENATLDSLKDGVELTLKQLSAAFEKSGLTEVNPVGEKFDPHRHQAVTTVEAEGEPNRVVTVFQKGYLLGDRVLRPALVVVSKTKADDAS